VVVPSANRKTPPSTPIALTRGPRRAERHQQPHACLRHQQPERAAEQGEQQALRNQLPDHPQSPRAQGSAHREFAAPLRAARQQQIGHVHTGDGEHQQYRAKDGEQCRPHAAGHVVLQRIHNEPGIQRRPTHPRKLLDRVFRDLIELAPGLAYRNARPQPSRHAKMMAPLPCGAIGNVRVVVLQRRPKPVRRSQNILKPPRHHADDGVKIAVQSGLAPHDPRVAAEALPPKFIAQHHRFGTMKPVVRRLEILPQRWRDTQHAEVARAHALSLEPLRLARASHARLPGLHHRNRIEGPAPLRHFAIGVERHVVAGAVEDVPQHHDPAGMRIGQRIEQNRLHRAEDGRARSDAERQNQNRSHGKAR
jgi:hypothetical protein